MRVAELHLERYGRFEDHRLVFPKAERDFHLVFGPNEAGKTTTLAAIADLLFGFEHSVAQDYRFGASLLRIGAVLENGAERFACRRRRGRQGTLIDADDRPIDEGALPAMLHGQRREAFLLSSSLDHARLRKGGQAMAESKDDLGQMLFAAGSGVTGLRSILSGLDADLDELWGPRRSDKRAYTRAERAFGEARATLRDSAVKPAEWTRAREERDRLRAEHLASDTLRRQAAGALAEAERLRRVFAPLARRATLLEELRANPPALPEAIETAARHALDTAAVEEQKRETARALLAGVLKRLEGVPDDAVALGLGEQIEALVQKVGAEVDRRDQLPRREQDLQARRAAAEAAARRLGLKIDEELTAPLPTEAEIARLRDLASRRVQLVTLQNSALSAMQVAETDVARAAAAQAELEAPTGLDVLKPTVDAARRAGDLDARVNDKRAAVSRVEPRLADALATLAPWAGEASRLARVTPPSEAIVDAAKAEQDLADREASEARRVASERAEALALAETRVASLSAGGRAVSLAQLNGARSARAAALAAVRQHVDGTAPSPHPTDDIERLDATITAADEIADRRFDGADASARLAQAEAEAAESRLRREQADERAKAALAAASDRKAEWRARLDALGLPALTPEELRAWLGRRARALELREVLAEAEADLQEVIAVRLAAAAHLKTALGEAAPISDSLLGPILAIADARLAEAEEKARAVADAKREHKEAKARLDGAKLERDRLGRELEAWRTSWDIALREAGLALEPEAAETRLGVFETLRGELEQSRSLKRRIDTVTADARAFAEEAAAVADLLGVEAGDRDVLELVRTVKGRLEAAKDARARRVTFEGEARARRTEIEAAQAALDATEMTLAEVRALTGAQDRITLAAALDASRRRREVERMIADLEREIREQGDGRSIDGLEAACAAKTPEVLAERAAELSLQANRSAELAQEASERAAQAELRFKQLDAGPAAADAAADLEQARAELESLAEVYLLKRTQRVLLDYAIRRQADRARNPLLVHAADLFRTLTLGRYADLRADREAEKPRLIGLCADGASTVAISDMSEGTQDQLFLALRLAAVNQSLEAGMHLPFLADDLFVNFDDDRARAGLEVLGELSRSTQVLFFTHHAHLKLLAEDVFGQGAFSSFELSQAI